MLRLHLTRAADIMELHQALAKRRKRKRKRTKTGSIILMEGEAEAGVAAQVEVAAEAVASHQGKCGLFVVLTGE